MSATRFCGVVCVHHARVVAWYERCVVRDSTRGLCLVPISVRGVLKGIYLVLTKSKDWDQLKVVENGRNVSDLLRFHQSRVSPIFRLGLWPTKHSRSQGNKEGRNGRDPDLGHRVHFTVGTISGDNYHVLLPFPFAPIFRCGRVDNQIALFSSTRSKGSKGSGVVLRFQVQV